MAGAGIPEGMFILWTICWVGLLVHPDQHTYAFPLAIFLVYSVTPNLTQGFPKQISKLTADFSVCAFCNAIWER